MKNQRQLYGEALVSLGKKNPDVVALEADLGGSTMSNLFEAAFPDRYFQMGIAEQNMASFAAGLALTGKIPFTHSFAMFATGRCYEQVRQSICIGSLRVRIVGSSAGLSDFGDGATHQCIEDISLMTGLPHMTVLVPADGDELLSMMDIIVDIPGPVYLRINRNDVPDVPHNDRFELGKPRLIRDGKDVIVFANGIMVNRALDAANVLTKYGIDMRVVNVSTVKPLDTKYLHDLVTGMRMIVTVEEHTIYGGMGSVLAVKLGKRGIPIRALGIQDRFGQSAKNYDELLAAYDLTAESIIRTVMDGLEGVNQQ
ncbi:MAG: transketolase C-terminal domain-containing protein [Termitinemataceae bacterium]